MRVGYLLRRGIANTIYQCNVRTTADQQSNDRSVALPTRQHQRGLAVLEWEGGGGGRSIHARRSDNIPNLSACEFSHDTVHESRSHCVPHFERQERS